VETGPTSLASSEMNIDKSSTCSSVIDMTVSASDDEDDIEEKIVKAAENKICKSVAICLSKYSHGLQLKISKRRSGGPLCTLSMKSDRKLFGKIIKRVYGPLTLSLAASSAQKSTREALGPTAGPLE